MEHRAGRVSLAVIAFGAVLVVLGGCAGPDNAGVYTARCEPIQKAGIEGSLTTALARQAEENRTYRDCLERRSVRLGR